MTFKSGAFSSYVFYSNLEFLIVLGPPGTLRGRGEEGEGRGAQGPILGLFLSVNGSYDSGPWVATDALAWGREEGKVSGPLGTGR